MIFEKKKAHLLYKKTGSRFVYRKFSELRSSVKQYSDFLFKKYIDKVETSVKSNVKYFYNYITKLKKSPDLPSSLFLNNVNASSPPKISVYFSEFFE